MAEPKEATLGNLQNQFPVLASKIGDIAIGIDRAWKISGDLKEAQNHVRALEHTTKEHAIKTEPLFYELVKEIDTTDSLTPIEKIALVNVIRESNSHHLSWGALPSEEAFKLIVKNYNSVLPSLNAVEKITARDGQPVLYFEIKGGNYRYINDIKHVEPAEVQGVFNGLTNGRGLEIDANFDQYYASGHVGFGLRDCDPGKPFNFVCGYFQSDENPRMRIVDTNMLVGTAVRARQIMEYGLHAMQINPVFVGDSACKAATEYLNKPHSRQDHLYEVIE